MTTEELQRVTVRDDPVTAGWEKPPATWKFDELVPTYNFPHDQSDRVTMFCSFVRNEAERYGAGARGLDIGCGVGIGQRPRATEAVSKCFAELWGIEPDVNVKQPPVFARVLNTVFEQAELPENRFDVAYSYMVMEHVADPVNFMTRLYKALAPGGEYLFLTVNGRHFFSRVSNTLRALHLDEMVLRMIVGKKEAEGYHYPTQYRFNSPAQIGPVCEKVGFEKPEFVYVERSDPLPYLKGPLKPMGRWLVESRHKHHRPERLLDLFCRVRKPK